MNPSRDMGFSPVPKHLPWLWGISSLLFNVYQEFFQWNIEAGA
jgi:hypothetical protein